MSQIYIIKLRTCSYMQNNLLETTFVKKNNLVRTNFDYSYDFFLMLGKILYQKEIQFMKNPQICDFLN